MRLPAILTIIFLCHAPCFAQGGNSDVAVLKLRAEAGDVAAQDRLGETCLSSFYYADAAKWFRAAAGKGVTNSQWRLGQIMVHGKPAFPKRSSKVDADPAQGIRWLRKAACNGHTQAQIDLGRCFEQGLGAKKDPTEAFKWFTLASHHDGIMARVYRDQLALKLTPADLKEGQRRADVFVVGQLPTVWESVSLKGISGTTQRRYALINNKTVQAGEQFSLNIDGSPVQMHCDEVRSGSVIITVGMERKELFMDR